MTVILAVSLALPAAVFAASPMTSAPTDPVFINEIHYDNTGTDTGEAIEIAGPAGTDLTGWSLVLYNGANGLVYDTTGLAGTIPDQQAGFGTVAISYGTNGIQNGSPDGIALVDGSSTVRQFLSYEGTFVAGDGPASGMTSTDIGVAEPSTTAIGDSLQLMGTGSLYGDFTWSGPSPSNFGAVNTGQIFEGGAGNAPIIPDCGTPLTLLEGAGGSQAVSASDADGTVTGISLSVAPPTGDITLNNVTPAAGVSGTATATVDAAASLAVGSYAATVEFSNDDAAPQTAQCTVSITVVDFVPVYEIQGSGQFSPYVGQTVATFGVVTLISGNGQDMWIQDPSGDHDPATSDGIFVDDRNRLSPLPNIGDFVVIIGEVEEQQFGTALPLTRIDDTVLVEIVSSGNPLPDPVRLHDLPDEVLSDGIDFWEPLEGMLVEARNARVTAATNGFGEFGMLTRRDARPGSGYFPQSKHILLTEHPHPGIVVDYNPERIMVDDSALPAPDVRPGDKIGSLVGVVDYTFSMYKLQIASIDGLDVEPIPTAPVSRRSGPKGNLSITTFNVENLFDLIDNPDKDDQGSTPSPARLETQLTKLAMAIELELQLPEILVVQEVENQALLQELGDRVNASAGTNYRATSFETSDARGIEAGFLWDEDRVDLLMAFQLTDDIVPGVSDAFGPLSASPGREPIVGVFDVIGDINQPLTIVGNHFKSKSGDDPLYGVNDPPIRITEVQRKMQARVVRDYVNQLLDANHQAWVMVAGDLNDFPFGEPGEGADHPLAILEGGSGEVPLFNLVHYEREADQYSFVFDGNSQVLDHMLVSPELFYTNVGHDFLHFNVGYPDTLNNDATTPLAASDHDPFEGRFKVKKVTKAAFTLTLLHNNDGESRLINAPGQPDFGGAARFKTLVDNLKAAALEGAGKRGVVMLSSGDNFLAGPEFNASLQKGVPYYDSIAIRLIGYDAMAIGNHEFDFGPDVLANLISGTLGTLPFVSANLDFSGEPNLQALVDQGDIVKSLVVEQGGERIGIVGATTPAIAFISSPRNVVPDPNVAAAIQAEVDALQASGVNKIVLISHLQSVAEDLALAPMLRGVDVMIAGGGDEVLANPDDLLVPGDAIQFQYPLYATGADGATIPVVTTAGDYKYVGRLVVGFTKDGHTLMVDDLSGPVRVAGGANPDAVVADPDVQAQVVDPVQAYVDGLAANIIGTSEVALEGRRSPGVRTMETNEGNLMADSLFWQASQLAAAFGVSPPDVALQNGGGIRNNNLIPAGPISELTTFSIAPFSNFVTVVENIPRSQFKEIMENAVSRVEFVDGRFAQISGFSMVYSLSGTPQVLDGDGNVVTPGTRVQELTLNDGTPIVSGGAVVAGPDLTIATIDFLANGGDQYPYRGAPFTRLGATYQQALRNYIVDGLGGLISAGQYPEGGEGRITQVP